MSFFKVHNHLAVRNIQLQSHTEQYNVEYETSLIVLSSVLNHWFAI